MRLLDDYMTRAFFDLRDKSSFIMQHKMAAIDNITLFKARQRFLEYVLPVIELIAMTQAYDLNNINPTNVNNFILRLG